MVGALVAAAACAKPSGASPPHNVSTAAVADDDALVGTRGLHYRLTEVSDTYAPDDPRADGEGLVREREDAEIACTQVTTALGAWRVFTLRCDPDAGMFGSRAQLEGSYAVGAAGLWDLGDGDAAPTAAVLDQMTTPEIAMASPPVDSLEVKDSRCAVDGRDDGAITRCFHPRRGLTWVEVVWNQQAGPNGTYTAELVRVDPRR